MYISTDNGIIRKQFGDLKAAQLIHEAGFDGIDYTFYEMEMVPEQDIFELTAAEWRRLADEVYDYAKSVGLSFPQAHAPYLYTLAEDRSGKHFQDVLKSFEFCARIHCPQMVIHTLKFPLTTAREDVDRINADYLCSFLPYAEEYDVNIGVENLFVFDSKRRRYCSQHGTPEEMNAFLDRLDHPRFVSCCDVGHCALTGCEPEDFIAGMSSQRLTMLHVQDLDYVDDRHYLPYQGMLNWEGITSALAKIGFEGPMNLEVLHFYDRFPRELLPEALRLAAVTARQLADLVEQKASL